MHVSDWCSASAQSTFLRDRIVMLSFSSEHKIGKIECMSFVAFDV